MLGHFGLFPLAGAVPDLGESMCLPELSCLLLSVFPFALLSRQK